MDEVLPEAIKTGYKLIDTAFAYGNQEGIGMTIGKLLEEGKIKVLLPVIVSKFGQFRETTLLLPQKSGIPCTPMKEQRYRIFFAHLFIFKSSGSDRRKSETVESTLR